MRWPALVLLLLLLVGAAAAATQLLVPASPLVQHAQLAQQAQADACVCVDLRGPVRDCCCDYETVEHSNAQLAPALLELLQTQFFRHYKVNLHAGCPFWPDDSQCHIRDCSVHECPDEDVPPALRERDELGAVDFSNLGFPLVKNCRTSDKDFCFSEGDASPDCHYVDLLRNPEAYTGYAGPSAHRIWRSVYDENCFKPDRGDLAGGAGGAAFSCNEKRVFYRLVSGLHSSIAAHLASRYFDRDLQAWTHNDTLFSQRLGAHADRLENLYFVYNVVLRAVAKVAPYIDEYDLTTGNPAEDGQAESLMRSVVVLAQSCPRTFDESTLFASPDSTELKEQFKTHFRNISRIMDCVGCEKCRLWGKLQIQGLGTALKILFSYDAPPGAVVDYDLRRNEVVALFNLLGRLSESLIELEAYRGRARRIAAAETADSTANTSAPAGHDPAQLVLPGAAWSLLWTLQLTAVVVAVSTAALCMRRCVTPS